ncbi:MAG: ATP-binding cassette domain-containing protein [Candidatus Dormibacteraceae bacterium]
MTEPAIVLAEVTKAFGRFTALDQLSLTVERGEIFGVLGPNGSGKTTTVNLISGLSQPTAGKITVLGHDLSRDPAAIRRRLGAVPQETALYEELSAEANLRFHAELFDYPRAQIASRINMLLNLVQLDERRASAVSTFSGGMKRRLALARALLHEPELIYLDEPTLGVDVQSRRALWDHILRLREQGRTVLITTNYLEEANILCDRVAIIDHGKLVVADTPAALKSKYGDTIIDLVLEPAASPDLLTRLRALDGVTGVAQDNGTLKVTVEGERSAVADVVALCAEKTRLRAITQREPSLDEIFLELTGKGMRD